MYNGNSIYRIDDECFRLFAERVRRREATRVSVRRGILHCVVLCIGVRRAFCT